MDIEYVDGTHIKECLYILLTLSNGEAAHNQQEDLDLMHSAVRLVDS